MIQNAGAIQKKTDKFDYIEITSAWTKINTQKQNKTINENCNFYHKG